MAPTGQQLALHIIDVAKGYVGIDRETDPDQIGKFLALFDLPFEIGGVPVSFCAAGVSYAACKAYADLTGQAYTADDAVDVFKGLKPEIVAQYALLSPRCHEIQDDAITRGIWVTNEESNDLDILPGWWVLYDWQLGQPGHVTTPDHIGIVINAGDTLSTVEFNTSDANNSDGGAVELRQRTYDNVVGFVMLYR